MVSVELDRNLLSILNDDSIYKILEWLSLEELCLFSRTCKRIQALCANHFRRKFPNEATKEVAIRFTSDGKLQCKKYVKYFYNFIKNLTIRSCHDYWNEYRVFVIVNFVKMKCDPNLRQINICGNEGNLNLVPFCMEIKDFLHNVEVVELIGDRIWNASTFLKYCTNLTTLSLLDVLFEEKSDPILLQKYKKLKHFHSMCSNMISFRPERLKQFFQENDRIECMSWSCSIDNLHDQKRVVKQLECIEIVVNLALSLQHLSLVIDEVLAKRFELMCNYLKVLCDRDNFKSLELYFNDSSTAVNLLTLHANQLAEFKQLIKIRFGCSEPRLIDMIPALRSLVHLKIIGFYNLHYEHNWMDCSDLELIDKVDKMQNVALNQIEELSIDDGLERQLFAFVMLFVRHWANLKKITVPLRRCGPFYIAELNRARAKLKNACELTIFTHNQCYSTNLADYKLVKLKTVQRASYIVNCLQEHCMSSL